MAFEDFRRAEAPATSSWLHRCQRISRAAALTPGLGRAWPALSRGVRQYWARHAPPEVLTDMAGLRLPVRLSDHVEAGIFWYGFPAEDRGVLQQLQARLPEDGVVVDIGANIGCFALLLARHLGHGQVHAFEPVPEAADRLEAAAKANAIGNIRLNRCALSKADGEIDVWVPEAHWKGSLYNRGRSSRYVGEDQAGWRRERARCRRLDDYVREAGIARIDAIKIDIEGAELDALEGAVASLRRFQPVVAMELNAEPLAAAGRSVAEVLTFWRDQGYGVARIAHGGGLDRRAPDGRGHCNILCLPSG